MRSRSLGAVAALLLAVCASPPAQAGPISEYSAGSGTGPVGITSGPAGRVWAAGFANNTIVELSALGTLQGPHSIPTAAAGPNFITAGPDGNVWFTESNANALAVMNATTYAVTEKAIPTANSGPVYVVTGRDGRLWFTEATANQVAAYDPLSNAFQSYTTFSPNSQLTGITTGPDGNMWVTEQGSSTVPARLARITSAGVVTEFATGLSPRAAPLAIVTGPDGALWFTETGGSGTPAGIGRFDPVTQTFTEYRSQITSGATPRGLAVGADGALWFTLNGPNGIGRITTSGAVTEYFQGVTGSSGLFDITPGPPGDPNSLWFTENTNPQNTGGLIGRIALDAPVVATGGAGSVASASAVVAGTVDPRGLSTSYRFEYGLTTAYGNSAPAPPASAGAGNAPLAVSTTLTGLSPGSTYHYRLVATNPQGSKTGNDATFATSAPGPTPPAPPPTPASPSSTTATPVSGTVLVRLAGTARFVTLSAATPIGPGSVVDVTHGRVTICKPAPGRPPQCADFYGGMFMVQSVGRHGRLTLKLVGGDFKRDCLTAPRGRARPASRSRPRPSNRVVRSLWGSGHGTFSTHGRYAAAAVRGTIWLTQDRCDATRVAVSRGIVDVLDLVRHRSIAVGAGHQYVARPRG